MVAVAAVMALLVPTAPAGASNSSEKNHPAYWEDLGYGTCSKTENPATPYLLPAAPAGTTWTLLVVKAGSESSTNDPHAEYHNPTPGPYYHPSGKNISHVIRCYSGGGGSTTTTSTPSSTSTSDPCGTYTPRQLALSSAAAEPGESITVSGVAGPGDNLVITISNGKMAAINLGSVATAANGSFSIDVIIPDSLAAGRYTITVKSTNCNRSGDITFTTQSVDRSGCGSDNPLVIVRGVATSWNLTRGTPPFNQNKAVTLTLTRRVTGGVTYNLGGGAWPASGTRTITVPSSAVADRYFLVQSGSQQGNNKPRTESCPVRIVESPSSIAAIGGGQGPGPGLAGGARTILFVALGAFVLLSLRQARRASIRHQAA